MAEPTFGLSINQEADEPRAVAGADMSVVAFVGTAPAADAAKFPYDTEVEIRSGDVAALTALGATGTLPDAVAAVHAQLGEFQVGARIIVVRVEAEETDAETIANIIADGKGLDVLTRCPTSLGLTPRLIGVPGFTHQRVAPAANAVCAALPPILNTLLAQAVVDGPNTTDADDKAWRQTISHKRIIPVTGGVKVMQGADPVAAPLAPRVIGLAVALDHANGGIPSASWANRPIQGIVGPARAIPFSLLDGSTPGQDLLAHQIGILVRGEAGVDGSIADGGFVFIGTDNAGDDVTWRQYHQVRIRDWIHLYFIRAHRFYLGRSKVVQGVVKSVMDTMKFRLRDLQSDGHILGFKVEFRADQNQPDDLRLGRITIRFAAEEAPVLTHIGLQSVRMREALDDLLESLTGSATE